MSQVALSLLELTDLHACIEPHFSERDQSHRALAGPNLDGPLFQPGFHPSDEDLSPGTPA